MELGKHYTNNKSKFEVLTADEFKGGVLVARRFIKNIIGRSNVLYGPHGSSFLGEPSLDYYVSTAIEKLVLGTWEWKEERSFKQQLIRVIGSELDKSHKRFDSSKLKFENIENPELFCDSISDAFAESSEEHEIKQAGFLKKIEETIKDDQTLMDYWECIKSGLKRTEIAELMEISPEEASNIRDRFKAKIKNRDGRK